MERLRSFSVKSTLSLTFFALLASSFLFFFSFSFWIFRLTPLVRHETHPHFNATASFDPSTVEKLSGLVGGSLNSATSTDWSSKDSILVGTRFEKRANITGSVEWTVLEQVREGEEDDDDEVQGKGDAVSANDTVSEESREEEGFKGHGVGAEMELGRCDLMNGRWVYDENYPLYTNSTCPYIDEGFDCNGNGRKDKSYMKWRWQPHACETPRFNATSMLEMMRGKRVVFVGDSINRNQWESLLCLLLGGVGNPSRVYETRGRKITKERGNYCFRFAVIAGDLILVLVIVLSLFG